MHLYTILLLIVEAIAFNVYGLAVRDTSSDISTTKGGVFVKNGIQTSCELGVIDSTAAFVAAPCLDFVGDKVSYSTTYEVYLDAGINNTPAKYKVDSITVHPYYNSTYYFNPIAILQFNSASTESWSNPIAIDQFNGWGDILFIRRGMTNISTMDWSTPKTIFNQYPNNNVCSFATYVKSANSNDLLCLGISALSTNNFLSHCTIPYGSVSVYINKKLYVAGINAYTISTKSLNTCSMSTGLNNYYVLFSNYIAFANKVLGRDISYYSYSKDITPQNNADYSVNYLFNGTSSKYQLQGGDFINNQYDQSQVEDILATDALSKESQSMFNTEATISSSSIDLNEFSSSSIADISELLETQSDTSNDIDNSNDNNHGVDTTKKLIIGIVCGVLGNILLTAILIYAYRRWKRFRRNIYRNFNVGSNTHSLFILDSGITRPPSSVYLPTSPTSSPNIKGILKQ